MRCTWVIDVLHHDAEGHAVTTWKFRPL